MDAPLLSMRIPLYFRHQATSEEWDECCIELRWQRSSVVVTDYQRSPVVVAYHH